MVKMAERGGNLGLASALKIWNVSDFGLRKEPLQLYSSIYGIFPKLPSGTIMIRLQALQKGALYGSKRKLQCLSFFNFSNLRVTGTPPFPLYTVPDVQFLISVITKLWERYCRNVLIWLTHSELQLQADRTPLSTGLFGSKMIKCLTAWLNRILPALYV